MHSLSRRVVLKSTTALLAAGAFHRSLFGDADLSNAAPELISLTSTSGVTLPPKGRAFLKFSFDFPEPSVEFGGHQISFRVYTYENVYAIDPHHARVEQTADSVRLVCEGLTWAGGQEEASGSIEATIQKTEQGLSIRSQASVPGKEIKSIAAIVRWLPRGEISRAGGAFTDLKEDEFLASWPDFNAGLVSPIIVLRSGRQYISVSLAAEADTARTTRFYLQPGEEGYRAELVYEREAWTKSDSMETATWHIRKGESYAEVARPHYAHVEKAFQLADWETRKDVPSWMKSVSLVVSLHGADWTGYIFNDYEKQLRILKWVADQMDASKVAVFLPAWDGRYYWNYPAYEPDPRMGGEAGFRRLIDGAHKLGFHLVAMFGSNVANKDIPAFAGVRDAVTVRTSGDEWNLDFVDWDNDRRGEANYGFMNLGVPSWQKHLEGRIVDILDRFHLDGYFLDILGVSENNRQGDMFLGTRQLVRNLRKRFPDKLAMGEMHYDALLGSIAVYQADVTSEYPEAFYKYGRMFEHLSWPAPGRGSTGVHEYGFSGRGRLPNEQQRVIPTLSVVDDTFTKNREGMMAVIDIAKKWKFPSAELAADNQSQTGNTESTG